MSEFSTGFFFDLQRFATAFKGDYFNDQETGIKLSDLFEDGKAAIKPSSKEASVYSGNNTFFWDKASTVVDLKNDANESVGGAISLVSGKFDTFTGLSSAGLSNRTGYVITELSAIDVRGIGASGTALFNNIKNTTILNPIGTIAVGNTTLEFGGAGEKAVDTIYGDNWEVGTQISVKSGAIANVKATNGEQITTADKTVADFSGNNVVTFSNKSFNTISTFSEDGTAALAVNASDSLSLDIDVAAGLASNKAGVTTTFNGQALASVAFNGSSVEASVSYGGTKNVGNDVAINGSAINVSNIDGANSTIIYSLNPENGNVLDVFGVTTKSNKTLTVGKVGGAEYLVAQGASDASTTISIAGETYSFVDDDSSGGLGAMFKVDKGKVSGFVFRDDGDSITISKSTNLSNFKLYKATASSASSTSPTQGSVDEAVDYAGSNPQNEEMEELPFKINVENSDQDYTVSKTTSGYTIEVFNGSEVSIETDIDGTKSTVEMDVTLNTLSTNRKSPASIIITVNEDGVLQSITDGSATGTSGTNTGLQVSGSSVKITGMNETNTASDFAITVGNDSVSAYVESGQYEYAREGAKNSTDGVNTIYLSASKDTLTSASPNTKIYPYEGSSGTLVYGTNELEYNFDNSSGKAYFTIDATDLSLDFVFVEAGDAITIPDGAASITGLQFVDKSAAGYTSYSLSSTATIAAVPTVSGGDSYTVTMTTSTSRRSAEAEFEVNGIYQDATVDFGGASFIYGASGGTFLFAQNGSNSAEASGFTAASGIVEMNQAAAEMLSIADERDNPRFTIDGTAVRITSGTLLESDLERLTYNHDDKSLLGLGDGAYVYDAGAITKIYAPLVSEIDYTFANDDAESTDDDQVFTAQANEGDATDTTGRAFFTVDKNKVTGFTFAVVDDVITSNAGFSGITLTDEPTGNTFAAPIVTNADGEVEGSTIVKTVEDYDGTGNKDCYSLLGQNLADRTVTFEGDDTTVKFNDVMTDEGNGTELLFSTAGKMLSIINLYEEGNEIEVTNAVAPVFIDQREIDIEAGGFKYRMLDSTNAAIEDLKAGSNVLKADVDQIRTIAGQSGIGEFSFGTSGAVDTFSVSAAAPEDNDSVTFLFANKDLNVTGISAVNGTESVTGALNGLILNGGKSVVVSGGEDDIYTFSGTSFGGLTDGDKVTSAGDMTDFITESEGEFSILGTSMAIDGDSSVIFNVAGGSTFTGIQDLAGTAYGDFTEELGVNNETVKVTGDNSIGVTGDNDVVTAINGVGGGSIALEQIGSASIVDTNVDGVFNFVEAQQTFSTSGIVDGVTFGIADNKVTSITGVDQDGERVTGDFSNGITVDGKLLQVENNGEDITYVIGSHSGMSGTGIYGLKDGANVVSASGINVAVAVGQSGTYTFGEQQFTIANDSNEHVGFLLENGKVTGIFDVDGEVSGNLNGIVINQKDPEIRVVGTDGENKDLTYSDGLLTGIKDGDTVQAADNVSTVRAIEGGTFTFGSQSYTTDDEDGVDFVVETGTTNVVGVSALADGAVLTGALSGLSSINGQSVVVLNDDNYGVIGASAGVKEIFDVSGGAEVVFAGGASKVTTDFKGTFTIGGESFTTEEDDVIEFALDSTGAVTGISGLSGGVVADSDNFDDMTINGQSFAITGDEDDLKVVGTDTEDGISALEKVGGASVAINNAGGATSVKTDKAGAFNFVKGGQSFSTDDTELDFTLNSDEKVTDIANLDSDITGNFNDVDTVNTKTVRVTDRDNILTITGQGGSAIATISDVDGDATITNVGGASQVITKIAGSFSFAGHTDPFVTSGDDVVTFDMVADADAKVKGITGIDDGSVTGNLGDLETINGQSFAVTGDEDESFTFEKNGSAATVSGVAGDTVDIQALAGASTVELAKDGNYTFGGKAYDIATGGSATIGVNGLSVVSITGLDQDGESVAGDFTSNISVGGKNVNVLGDTAITVAQENGELVIRGLNDGATIEAADDIFKANTEEAGPFADTDAKTVSIGNGDALILLDGAAHIIGLSGVTGGVSGDITNLPINGSSSLVNVISAPDGHSSTNLTYDGTVLGGVVAGDTVLSAGDATLVVANGADGAYQFGTGSAAQSFSITGDTNGVLNFTVGGNSHTVVSAIDDIDEGATLTGKLGGLSINGGTFQIDGDQDEIFGAVGDAAGAIGAITKVGGGSTTVTVVSAAGADEIETDTEGKFNFAKSGQRFTVAGDSSVTFGINDEESVLSVTNLDGTVASDFSNPLTVNDSEILIYGDRDGNSVVGADGTVTEINDVNAGSLISLTGNAAQVNTKGEGVYTFVGNDGKFEEEKFTVSGDAAISFDLNENGDVAGVTNFTRVGTDRALLTFDAATSPVLNINPDVNDPVEVTASSSAPVTVEVDSAGKIIGVAGVSSIAGLEDATIQATGPITIGDDFIDIVDADNSFNVVVNDFEVEKVTDVTGNATINVEDGVIETNADGAFNVGGEDYTVVDENDSFGLTTDPSKDLSGVSSLEGSIVIEDGNEELTVNGNEVNVNNANSGAPVTISTDGASITAVDGLVDGAIIEGALDNASIAMASVAANDANNLSVLAVNDTVFALMGAEGVIAHAGGYNVGDKDGITLNGKGEVTGLDDGARMFVTEQGTYTVNGSVINAVVGDTIMGAGAEGAYLYDPDNILVRKSTPISTIASLTGIPTTVDSTWGSYEAPLAKEELDASLASAEVDKDKALAIYSTNDEKTAQDIDLSGYKFTKKVHLFNGDQNLALNSEGGNLVHVEETYLAADGNDSPTSGKKNIVLGNGDGDVVVVDQAHDLGNEVNIMGGTGDDSIFVRNNVDTTINMSAGGADKVVTFAAANARIALEGYNASTGAGVQFDQLSLRDSVGGIANAVESGVIDFGDGVVSLNTGSGTTEVSLNGATGGTASVGGSVVNIFSPEGTRQQVAFTHSAGGTAAVDANSTEDVIFIGNKDGKKEGGSVLQGGLGNDVAFAGEGDAIDLGDGLNVVNLDDNVGREGAFVNLAKGNTVIYNTNSTLDEIHGDTLGVDLATMDLEYVDGNLIVKSKDTAESVVLATIVAADKDGTISYDTAATATGLAESADLASSADDADTTATSSSDTTASGSTDTTTAESTEDTVTVAAAASLTPDHNYTNQLINSNGTLIKAAIGATGSVIDAKLDEDVRANYYLGDNSGLTFYGYNGNVFIDLEGDWLTAGSSVDGAVTAIEGITSIAAGTGLNYVKGSDENETFFAGRGNSHLYGDGGRNLLVGYTGSDKEGQTTFYVLGNAYDAANTIQAFDFVDDDNYTNNNRITADKLEVDLPTNYVNRVEVSNNDVVVNVTNRNGITTESVIITGAIDSVTGYGQDILIAGDGVVEDVVAQVGTDKLKFDKFANYYNATGKNATVDVANDKDFAQVWLDGSKGVNFQGDIHVINAADFIGSAELAGNDYNNTVIAGSGTTSLWGGNKGDDALIAGSGQDTFYYTLGNGTDTIYGAKDGDIVNLAGVTLDQITGAEFSETGVALNFRDGGKLYIGDNGGNDVGYVVNGETYFVNEEHNGFVKKA